MSNQPPSEVPQGAIRFNTDSQRMEFFAQDRWHEFATEESSGLGGRAFRTGGPGTIIETFNIATEGNAVDTGFDLSVGGGFGSGDSAHAGSRTRAVIAGGSDGGSNNTIQFFTMASLSNSIDFGDTTRGVYRCAGHSDNTRMVVAGQASGNDNTMELITIPSLGNAVDYGDLHTTMELPGACGSPTRALFGGGDDNGDGNPVNNNIQFCTIATTGNALDFGDLTAVKQGCSGLSNSVRGCFIMGNIGYVAGNTQLNNIDFVTIASTGNAQDFGDSTTPQTTQNQGTASNSTRGLFFGGYSSPANPSNSTPHIHYININTKGDSTNFGDLTVASGGCGGHCDTHGGLQ